MQTIFNLAYWALNKFFSLFSGLHAPGFLVNVTTFFTEFASTVNYYIPLNTLVTVAVICLTFQLICMGISALLQIF